MRQRFKTLYYEHFLYCIPSRFLFYGIVWYCIVCSMFNEMVDIEYCVII
jgi:hypothetical protein